MPGWSRGFLNRQPGGAIGHALGGALPADAVLDCRHDGPLLHQTPWGRIFGRGTNRNERRTADGLRLNAEP